MKKILAILIVLLVIGLVFSLSRESKPVAQIPVVPQTQETPTNICYYRSDKTASGLYDRAWLRLNIKDGQVIGEFNNYPAEKDSKIGTFIGEEYRVAQDGPGQYFGTWDTKAEGMTSKEELLLKTTPIDAQAAFGEMVQGANGTYVYKDKSTVTYQQQMSQIDCGSLDEILAVETYVRATDLQALTKTSPVLGGKLFVSSVVVNPSAHTALISYEDGHIAGKGALVYSYDQTTKKVTVNSFTKAQ